MILITVFHYKSINYQLLYHQFLLHKASMAHQNKS